MIKLKSLLVENRRKRSHCWMDPNGRIIPVRDTHDSDARTILNPKPLTYNPRDYNDDPVVELWKRGFLRVTYMYDGSLIAHNEVHPPNDKQISVLKNIAVEGEHSKIEFDNGKDKPKILWSEFDVIQEENKTTSLTQLDALIKSWRKVKENDIVNGLEVKHNIPNISSISASLTNYKGYGIREVPIDIFSLEGGEPALANAIRQNRWIEPLIVVVDGHPDGVAYILEGSHRIDALKTLGVKTFPALVILDLEDLE